MNKGVDAPTESENVFRGHGRQEVVPAKLNVPRGHGTHAAESGLAYVPAGQTIQSSAPPVRVPLISTLRIRTRSFRF